MTLIRTKGARFGLALLGAMAWFAPAAAVAAQPAYTIPQPLPTDPLSTNLRILADSPHNVGALIGAGKAALELGDAQGALTFFARAEQDAPRDGWAKKWEGSALVQLEQPAAALKFFRDAVSMGVPDAAVAGDRGLAWDISGDPRRAQRDYRLALSQGSDPEVTRRLALSLAISGEREQALQLLQGQLEQRDRAAYRTRAFVLALTGDWQDADRAVESELPAQQAAGLEPFLAKLPTLSLADRALAVHLGHFPGTGRPAPPATSYAQNSYAQNVYSRPDYAGLPTGYRPTPQPVQNASREEPATSLDAEDGDDNEGGTGRPAAAASNPAAPRRIPGAQAEAPRPRPAPAVAARQNGGYEPPISQWSWSRGELPPPSRPATVKTASSQPAHQPAPVPAKPAAIAPRPVELADARTPAVPPERLAAVPAPTPQSAPPPAASSRSRSRLAEVAAELDRIEETQRARSIASSVQPDETRPSASRAHAALHKTPPAERREPVRHWVQLAHAADPSALPHQLAQIREKAPKLFAGRLVWTAESDETNRLLIGPFASEEAAQAFVDRLSKSDVTGLAWSSEAGEKIEKLAGR